MHPFADPTVNPSVRPVKPRSANSKNTRYKTQVSNLLASLFPKVALHPVKSNGGLYQTDDGSLVVWAGGGKSLFLGINGDYIEAIAQAKNAFALIYVETGTGMTAFALRMTAAGDRLSLGGQELPPLTVSSNRFLFHIGKTATGYFIKELNLSLLAFDVSTRDLVFVSGHWRRRPVSNQPVIQPQPATEELVAMLIKMVNVECTDPNYRIEIRVVWRD